MDKLLRARRAKRSGFKKACSGVSSMIEGQQPNLVELEAKMDSLKEKFEQLRGLDEQIYENILDTCKDEDELEKEEASTGEIIDLFNLLKVKTKLLLQKEKSDTDSIKSSAESSSSMKRHLNLPKLELRKFNGDVRQWLPFWVQFSKIDSESTLDESEKFQYLIQATVEGSKARELVTSYPPTASNYKNALKSLKARFGRDEVLIEVYVRELLGLVITNSRPGKKLPLSVLYDKIETQLRSLETLNVAPDTCAAMLYPLVESCLPEDVLRTWQRNQGARQESLTSDSTKTAEDSDENRPSIARERLTRLMSFLQLEVEGEERIALAMAGFGTNVKATEGKMKTGSGNSSTRPELPSAAGLMNRTQGTNVCVFCESSHSSATCEKAKTLPLSERGQILMKKGACLKCLKLGHIRKKCRTRVDCSICGKGHFSLMCPSQQKDERVIEKTLTSLCTMKTVQLQVLPIVVRGTKCEKTVRALLDTGSQRSYVSRGLAEELQMEHLRDEELAHSLFGGFETKPIKHQVFLMRVSSVERDFHCNFEVVDHQTICRAMEPASIEGFQQEMASAGVVLHDTNDGPIDVLIGADIYGKLMTGEIVTLPNGMTALKTFLGWTVMGKISNKKDTIATKVTLSCLVSTEPLARLWELDVLGISDPATQVSKNERLKDVKEWFEKTVRQNDEGRYVVRLPWLNNHPPLPTNVDVASKRTMAKLTQLENSGQLDSYRQVFHEWEAEGVIEKAPQEINGHYLPHRPVIKKKGPRRYGQCSTLRRK